jgi:uncharacterized phage protein (TIGR01671 family)
MREIKFRVFAHERDDEGCVGFLERDEFSHSYYDGGWRSLQYFIRFPAFTVQQYTGLKDKKGKEIYEGDIVKGLFFDIDVMADLVTMCPVVWVEDSACFNIGHRYWTKSATTVIGNIFETPELLET